MKIFTTRVTSNDKKKFLQQEKVLATGSENSHKKRKFLQQQMKLLATEVNSCNRGKFSQQEEFIMTEENSWNRKNVKNTIEIKEVISFYEQIYIYIFLTNFFYCFKIILVCNNLIKKVDFMKTS